MRSEGNQAHSFFVYTYFNAKFQSINYLYFDNSADRHPVKGSGVVQRDYEYVRKETISLLAGIDLLTGETIPYISDTHKSSDFIVFLKKLDENYPKGDKIRLILDNHSAHTSKETREYLTTMKGRFEFVF